MIERLKELWEFLCKAPAWVWGIIGAFALGVHWRSKQDSEKRAQTRASQAEAEAERADTDRETLLRLAEKKRKRHAAHAETQVAIRADRKKIQGAADLDDLADMVNETFD